MSHCHEKLAVNKLISPSHRDHRPSETFRHCDGFPLRDGLLNTLDRPCDLIALAFDAIRAPATSPEMPSSRARDFSHSSPLHKTSYANAPWPSLETDIKHQESLKASCNTQRDLESKKKTLWPQRHKLKLLPIPSPSQGTDSCSHPRGHPLSGTTNLPACTDSTPGEKGKEIAESDQQENKANDAIHANVSSGSPGLSDYVPTTELIEHPNRSQSELDLRQHSGEHSEQLRCRVPQKQTASTRSQRLLHDSSALVKRSSRESTPLSSCFSSSERAFELSIRMKQDLPASKTPVSSDMKSRATLSSHSLTQKGISVGEGNSTLGKIRSRRPEDASASSAQQEVVDGSRRGQGAHPPSPHGDLRVKNTLKVSEDVQGQQEIQPYDVRSRRRDRCRRELSTVGNKKKSRRRDGILGCQTGAQFDELVATGRLDKHLWTQERRLYAKSVRKAVYIQGPKPLRGLREVRGLRWRQFR